MYNKTEHCCLSCGADLSDKRIDAKYCSPRCRMRHRRSLKKQKVLNELLQTCAQLPNDVEQFQGRITAVHVLDENTGNRQRMSIQELKNTSIEGLKKIKKKKNVKITGQWIGSYFKH